MRILLVFTLLSCCLPAAELTGYIVDAPCGWNNARNTPEAKECARKCVKAGWDPVFVPDGNMNSFKIPDKAAKTKALDFVGEKVVITGELKGDTVRVDKIRIAKP